jgi:GntR family transcriptional regulator, transcriptional repressor for pyruvate dehydrogenase complex
MDRQGISRKTRTPTASLARHGVAGVNQDKVLTFSRIRQPRIFEKIAGRIRADIAAGVIRPGHKLPAERELAEQFGVSRTAVREALHSLEVSGLIRTYKGAKGGTFVLDGNSSVLHAIQELFSFGKFSLNDLAVAREVLLSDIVRLACEKATLADISALEKDTDNIEELLRSGRFRERLNYSIDFYRILGGMTGNRVLAIMAEAATHLMRVVIDHIGPPPFNPVASRRRLMKHMRAHNTTAAVNEMTDHLTTLHRYVLRRSKKFPSSPWLYS